MKKISVKETIEDGFDEIMVAKRMVREIERLATEMNSITSRDEDFSNAAFNLGKTAGHLISWLKSRGQTYD